MLKRSTLLVVIAALIFSLACGNRQVPDVLVIGIPADTDSFNPLQVRSRFGSELSKMMFSSLLNEEPDFIHFTPSLARSWQFLDDSTRIRFNLLGNVFWSDSVRLTAGDVAFSHQLYTDPDIGWVGSSVKDRITRVDAVDDSTVDFYFSAPYPYQLMDANEGVILPRHLLKDLDPEAIKAFDYTENQVSGGPYILKSYVGNQFIELTGNPLYYNPQYPLIKRVVFKIVPDKSLLLTQLDMGEIHMMDGIPPDQADFTGHPNIKVESFPYAQFTQISWNTRLPLFSDPEIRRALTLAIDRQALVDHLLKGYGHVSKGPLHPMLWAYNPDLETLPYDPVRAAAILKDRGWTDSDGDGYVDKDGTNFEFKLLTNIGSQVREDALVMIQEMMRQAGIKVIPQRLEWSVYVEKMINRDYDGLLLGMMSATKVDVFQVWHSSMTGNDGFNLSCYENPRIDYIIETAPELVDRKQAQKLWYEFQDILIQDQPATFLWIPDRIVGLDKKLAGYHFSPVSTLNNIHEWYWKH